MRRTLVLVAAAMGCMAAVQDDPSARDLQVLTRWFEGVFDNQEQIWFETEGRAKVPEKERHERVHATHRRVELPAFGEHVFYVEEYLDDDPAKVFRQRLITFESARERGVRMRLWFFKDAKAVLGAHEAPQKILSLTSADVSTLPECDVWWRAEADQYVGRMQEKKCVFGTGKERRYSQHDLVLSASKYWRIDRTFNLATDKLAVGNPSGVPHKMDRAKLFDCDVKLFGKNYLQGPSPDDQSFDDQRLHSQGGNLKFVRKGDGKAINVRLRAKEYPYYTERSDFMFLSVREGEGPFSALSFHDPDARFIGMNLGWMNVTCERALSPH